MPNERNIKVIATGFSSLAPERIIPTTKEANDIPIDLINEDNP